MVWTVLSPLMGSGEGPLVSLQAAWAGVGQPSAGAGLVCGPSGLPPTALSLTPCP